MMIHSMTATFGKLSHETLSLQPGLNVITAPNEWGKSTWSAFIISMFYGIDSACRSKKDALADKEHYAPWSGEPMSGRIDLTWQGRKITIERKNRGRMPFGDFVAFETDSGVPVPELTGENCGQMLLGVEKSVFQRAGFLRLQDLPVTQDEALRQRLNGLVTTGDESGTGENLEKRLRELKNRCRHNTTGLLPQAEGEREEILAQMEQIQAFNLRKDRITEEKNRLAQSLQELENHRAVLAFQENQEYARKAQRAWQQLTERKEQAQAQREICKNLPPENILREKLQKLQVLGEQQTDLDAEEKMVQQPDEVRENRIFAGISPETAVQRAKADAASCDSLREKKKSCMGLFWMLAALALAAGAVLLILNQRLPAIALMIAGAACIVGAVVKAQGERNAAQSRSMQAELLRRQYGEYPPEQWVQLAEAYRESFAAWERSRAAQQEKKTELDRKIRELTGGKLLHEAQQQLTGELQQYEALSAAMEQLHQAELVAEAFSGAQEQWEPPEKPDSLTCTRQETEQLLTRTRQELQQYESQLSRLRGQMDGLPKPEQLEAALEKAKTRIEKLRQTEKALLLAQKTRQQAVLQLQKRFAPQISGRAQELLNRMTGGRYVRLLLDENFSVQSGTEQEDVLRSSLWRSDGTADQLYLALRLAVAEMLTPEAPLVLDDALVRFDDTRVREALRILREEPMQVILFTCQSREETMLETL